jgi:hypothetical protein
MTRPHSKKPSLERKPSFENPTESRKNNRASLAPLASLASLFEARDVRILSSRSERRHKAPGVAKRNPGVSPSRNRARECERRTTGSQAILRQAQRRTHRQRCSIRRSHTRAFLVSAVTPGFASLHPGLYAVARFAS